MALKHWTMKSSESHLRSCCRYRSGIRGHMKAVVMDLLRQYLKVETQFQHGESCVTSAIVFLWREGNQLEIAQVREGSLQWLFFPIWRMVVQIGQTLFGILKARVFWKQQLFWPLTWCSTWHVLRQKTSGRTYHARIPAMGTPWRGLLCSVGEAAGVCWLLAVLISLPFCPHPAQPSNQLIHSRANLANWSNHIPAFTVETSTVTFPPLAGTVLACPTVYRWLCWSL